MKIIEKHLTLDRNLHGPDHKGSLEPPELKCLVSSIRNVESAFGISEKKILECEKQTRSAMKKSAFLARDIKTGEILNMSDLNFLRPGIGIDYKQAIIIIGKKFTSDIKKNAQLKIEMLE